MPTTPRPAARGRQRGRRRRCSAVAYSGRSVTSAGSSTVVTRPGAEAPCGVGAVSWAVIDSQDGAAGVASTSLIMSARILVSKRSSVIELPPQLVPSAGEVALHRPLGDVEQLGDRRGVEVVPIGEVDHGALS